MNKICVIGSNSFSGASFADYCLSQGAEVFAFSRSEELDDVFLKYKSNKNIKNLKFYQYDVNENQDEMLKLFKEEKIGRIVNFAAQSMVGQSWLYPDHWFRTNTLSTIMLHEKIRHLDFLDRYVHISTPEVYGSCSGDVVESTNYNPSTPYATSRAAADMSLKNFFDAYKFPVVFTRAANVFGEHQQIYRIIPKAIMCFLTGEKLPLHGGGHSVRSFIHIDDVSDATYKILENGKDGEIYHIATKTAVSIRKLVEMVAEKIGVNFDECVKTTEDRLGKDSAYLLDSTKLRETLHWKDKISLDEGIERTIAWVENNLENLKKQPQSYVHKA